MRLQITIGPWRLALEASLHKARSAVIPVGDGPPRKKPSGGNGCPPERPIGMVGLIAQGYGNLYTTPLDDGSTLLCILGQDVRIVANAQGELEERS